MPNTTVRWGETGDQTEPVDAKKDDGANAGKPEAAEYINWLLSRIAAGANLDRKEDLLLHMPLLNSLAIERGIGSVTFARSTIGTYIDRYGVLQTAAIDEARFEKEYLSEVADTNEMLQSENFNVTWTKNQVSIASGSIDGPDGLTNSADKLVEDGTDNAHFLQQDFDSTPGDNAVVSGFCFAKIFATNRDWIHLELVGKSGGSSAVWFDLVNGVVGTVEAGSKGRITALADDWYKCEIYDFDVTVGGNVPALRIMLATSDGGEGYQGDGARGTYIFGGQAQDLPYSTSYIPTTVAAVTRASDSLQITIEGNIPLQADPGTILCDVSILGKDIDGNNQYAWRIAGETDRYIIVTNSTNGKISAAWGDAAQGDRGPLTDRQVQRLGLRHEGGGNSSLWLDGVNIGTVSGADVSDALGSVIFLGSSTGPGQNINGHISNFRIYDRAFTDFEMAVA